MEDGISALIWLIFFWIFYIPFVWWLYTINKKLGEKNPWLSFFPILQYYSIVKASWKSLWWILWSILIALWVYIIIALIIGLIFVLVFAWNADFMILLEYFSNNIILSVIYIIILYILVITLINTWYIIILQALSKRTNRWAWTTLWLYLVPFIMFPVVAYKLKDQSVTLSTEDTERKKQKNIEL